MEIQKCFEALDVSPEASIEDVRQAYKDLVNIWHPDRVPDNPRLKKKAEEKLKDINLAYEELTSFLTSKRKTHPNVQKEPSQGPMTKTPPSSSQAQTETKARSPHVAGKPHSNFFSALWNFLSKILDGLSEAQAPSNETMGNRPERFDPPGKPRANRGSGMGRGKGMGRGRRGGGRRR